MKEIIYVVAMSHSLIEFIKEQAFGEIRWGEDLKNQIINVLFGILTPK